MSERQAGPRLRVAVVAAAAVLLLAGLGSIDVSAPDEPRYIQVAEEMRSMQHGPEGLVLLHLGGEAYTQKPPLYFWLAALAGTPGGRVGEWTGRLPSALGGLLVVVLTLIGGRRMLGPGAAVLGAAYLLTIYEFARLARRMQLDVLLCTFEVAAIVAFWWLDRGLGPRRRFAALFHLAMGLAVLVKGPVGFLIPALTVVAFLGWERRFRDLARAFPWWGFLLSVAPGVLWISAATSLAPAGFAADAIGENLFARFFAGSAHARPPWYFLYMFPAKFLPWTLLWPLVWWAGRTTLSSEGAGNEETRRAWRFLLANIAVSFVFFSISSGKRGLYMLPAFPAAALLCADATLRWLAGRAAVPRVATVVSAGVVAAIALLGIEAISTSLGRPIFVTGDVAAELDPPLLLAFGCAAIGTALAALSAWIVLRRNRASVYTHAGLVVATVFAVELATFVLLYPALDSLRTPRPLATAAAALTPEGRPIGLLDDRAMTGGLLYYADRPVVELRTAADVARFATDGGRAIVVKKRKVDRVRIPYEVVTSVRTGEREVLVVDVAPGADVQGRGIAP